jgi:hypothetical protein
MQTVAGKLEMESCPRWERCNAPICPLDPSWQRRVLHRDDPTCFYLTESVKLGAEANFEARGLGALYQAMVEATPGIRSRHRRIEKALDRAKNSGSKLARRGPWEPNHGN